MSATTIPCGYGEIVSCYGNPEGSNGNVNPVWEQQNIVRFQPPYPFSYQNDDGSLSPVSHFQVHKLIVADLNHILVDIYNNARLLVKQNDGPNFDTDYYDKRTLEVLSEHRCNVFSGSFCFRNKRGQDVPSVHSFGVALDFDALHNPFGSQQGTLPDWFIKPFRDRGWEWGGQWSAADKDWMHFQRAQGY